MINFVELIKENKKEHLPQIQMNHKSLTIRTKY